MLSGLIPWSACAVTCPFCKLGIARVLNWFYVSTANANKHYYWIFPVLLHLIDHATWSILYFVRCNLYVDSSWKHVVYLHNTFGLEQLQNLWLRHFVATVIFRSNHSQNSWFHISFSTSSFLKSWISKKADEWVSESA